MPGKPRIIHIFGASGSGTTTLGNALSEKLQIPVLDFDDYLWEKTDPPFQREREEKECLELFYKDASDSNRFILSGSFGSIYEQIDKLIVLAVFLYVPMRTRQERLWQREREQFGSRVQQGGDMYEKTKEFIEWAGHYDIGDMGGRNLRSHQARIASLRCPVLKFSNRESITQMVEKITSQLPANP